MSSKAIVALLLLTCLLLSLAGCSRPEICLVVIVTNAPKDMSISVKPGEAHEGDKRIVAWETYYTLYIDYRSQENVILTVLSGTERFEVPIDGALLQGLDNLISLDYRSRDIQPGKTPSHIFLTVLIGVFFGLLIEIGVFYLFGFREKRSWITLMSIAIIFQSAINLLVYTRFPYLSVQIPVRLMGGIFFLFIKAAPFLCIIKEHTISQRIADLLTADAVCFMFGILLLEILPH